MSWPSTVTLPEVAFTMPQTMLISVVLPAPFGPSSAKISPRRMSRLALFSADEPVRVGLREVLDRDDGIHEWRKVLRRGAPMIGGDPRLTRHTGRACRIQTVRVPVG